MLQVILGPSQVQPAGVDSFLLALVPVLLGLGWVVLLVLLLWIAWEVYRLLKRIDYISAIQWTFLQVTLPEDSEETPKAMEVIYDVLGGIHKSPDIVELFFDGYIEAWYSCEIQFLPGRARYIMVVPTVHRQLFEGVIYGQYPKASIREVEDYSQKYQWPDLREKFDMWGTEVILANDDYYPIKTYNEFETRLAEEERYTDPLQIVTEALTNINPGEEFWLQILVRPLDAGTMGKWSEEGQAEVAKISGQAKEEGPGALGQLVDFFKAIPREMLALFANNTLPEADSDRENGLRFFNPVDEARMKGILQKVSQSGYKVKIRIVYIAPAGQLQKPNISRGFGIFKQFNTFHLNGFKPDSATKTNGPNYFIRDFRRKYLERLLLIQYQSRDFWGVESGNWMTAEELATLYHFPVKYVKSPSVERAKAGLQTPPDNLPYA